VKTVQACLLAVLFHVCIVGVGTKSFAFPPIAVVIGLLVGARNRINFPGACVSVGVPFAVASRNTCTGEVDPVPCSNKQSDYNCDWWKGKGFCTNSHDAYMKKYCKKACLNSLHSWVRDGYHS
jgi:hypothetical protein